MRGQDRQAARQTERLYVTPVKILLFVVRCEIHMVDPTNVKSNSPSLVGTIQMEMSGTANLAVGRNNAITFGGARPPRAQWAAPSGPLGTGYPVHRLMNSFKPVFGARARRTAAEAAALPIP